MTHVNLPAVAIGNVQIHQRNGLFNLNDLHKASGGEEKHQPAKFTRLDTTQALIAEISNSPDVANCPDMGICIESRRGGNGGTYACRELVIAYAAWISAEFHLKVIRVFLDTVAPVQQHTLTLDDPHASDLDASIVNEIVSTTTRNIVETLHRQRKLIHWPEVIEALQNPHTDMSFPDLTALIHASIARFERSIDAEAYTAIKRRAAHQRVSLTNVSLSTGA